MFHKGILAKLLWQFSLGLLLFSGLSNPVPVRTEGLRIAIAEQMAETGNWIVPHLWGDPIFTKPPGFYWVLSFAQGIGGAHSLIGMRLVSVFSLIGMALASVFYLGVWGGSRFTGFLVYLTAMATTLASLGQVPTAEMDIPFSFWVLWFWMASIDLGTSGQSLTKGLFAWKSFGLGVLGGMAVLFKWTAPAFFFPAFLWILIFGRVSLARKVWGSVLCGIGVLVLPCIWMGGIVSQGQLSGLYDAILSEALPHLSPAHHTRSYPFMEWITFPVQVIGMSMPVSLPLLFVMLFRTRVVINYLSKPWPFILIGSLFIWTLIPGHRPRHALPVSIGIAIISIPLWKCILKNNSKKIVLFGCILLTLGISKSIYSFGTSSIRAHEGKMVESASEIKKCVGQEPLGLFQIKEDGFIWLTHIARVVKVSDEKYTDWVICYKKNEDIWISKGYVVHRRVELSGNTVLTLLFGKTKS